jgi:prepilin-type N-terminal cleavage/methylation domain-containing protein
MWLYYTAFHFCDGSSPHEIQKNLINKGIMNNTIMQSLKNIKITGFTLIEVMVVITIVGLLASVVLASLTDARAKARDTQRVQIVKELQKALELYRNGNGGNYPCFTLNCALTGAQGSSLSVNGTGAGVFPDNAVFDTAISPFLTVPLETVNYGGGTTLTQGSIVYRVGSATNATSFNSYTILLRREQPQTLSSGQTLVSGEWCAIRMGPTPNSSWVTTYPKNCF